MVNFPSYSETLFFLVKGAAAAAGVVLMMMMMIKTAMERHSTISKCLLSLSSGFVTSDGRVDTTSVTCEDTLHDKLVLGSCTRLQHSHEHDDDSDGGVRHESRSLA